MKDTGPECFLASDVFGGALPPEQSSRFDYFSDLESLLALPTLEDVDIGTTPVTPVQYLSIEQAPVSQSESSLREPKNEQEFIALLDDLNALEAQNKSLTKDNNALRRKLKGVERELAELKEAIKLTEKNTCQSDSPPKSPAKIQEQAKGGRTIVIPKSPFHNNPYIVQEPNPKAVTYHFNRMVKITLHDPKAPGRITITGVPKDPQSKLEKKELQSESSTAPKITLNDPKSSDGMSLSVVPKKTI